MTTNQTRALYDVRPALAPADQSNKTAGHAMPAGKELLGVAAREGRANLAHVAFGEFGRHGSAMRLEIKR